MIPDLEKQSELKFSSNKNTFFITLLFFKKQALIFLIIKGINVH